MLDKEVLGWTFDNPRLAGFDDNFEFFGLDLLFRLGLQSLLTAIAGFQSFPEGLALDFLPDLDLYLRVLRLFLV